MFLCLLKLFLVSFRFFSSSSSSLFLKHLVNLFIFFMFWHVSSCPHFFLQHFVDSFANEVFCQFFNHRVVSCIFFFTTCHYFIANNNFPGNYNYSLLSFYHYGKYYHCPFHHFVYRLSHWRCRIINKWWVLTLFVFCFLWTFSNLFISLGGHRPHHTRVLSLSLRKIVSPVYFFQKIPFFFGSFQTFSELFPFSFKSKILLIFFLLFPSILTSTFVNDSNKICF